MLSAFIQLFRNLWIVAVRGLWHSIEKAGLTA
jgi:hypothetical protein